MEFVCGCKSVEQLLQTTTCLGLAGRNTSRDLQHRNLLAIRLAFITDTDCLVISFSEDIDSVYPQHQPHHRICIGNTKYRLKIS